MTIHDVTQGTPEWFELRLGKLTASKAQAIATNGKGLDTLVFEKVAEIMTGVQKESYGNEDTKRGNDHEPLARNYYEIVNNVQVKQVGFITIDDQVGCSPDGLVNEDGLIEIKCLADSGFVKFVFDSAIDPAHEWQMQMQLLITGRKWCDLVVFNQNFPNPVAIVRTLRNEEKIKKLQIGIDAAKIKLADILKVVQK